MPRLHPTMLEVFGATVGCSPGVPDGAVADLVLVGGVVLTVDPDDRIAEAVAVRDGRIVAVGSDAQVAQYVGGATHTVDLNGRTVTPGLLDAHAHFGWGGADRLFVLDLSYPNVETVDDVVAKVAEQAELAGPGVWIRGRGWDEGKLRELRYILASDLDEVAPDNPVWLEHTMGHYGTANRLAMRMAAITPETSDPTGGTIDRDADGRPTGVMKEGAMGLITSLMPPMSGEQIREGMRELAAAFNQECMTGLKDPGISMSTWEAYQDVLSEGNLSVRVFALWSGGRSLAASRRLIERVGSFTRPYVSTGDDRLIAGGVKLFADGSGGARTAWMYQDWNKNHTDVDTGNRGYPAVDPAMLRQQILEFHEAGFHVSVHSVGDRTIDWVVDSYVQALDAHPVTGRRHGIIHANIPSDHAIDATARLQSEYDAGYPEPSPTFMWWIGDTYAGNFGPDRARRLNPFKTFQNRGIRWASASDYTVTPFPARYGIWASVARETLLGVYGVNPYGMDEAVDVRTALKSFTIWGAHQMFLEDKIGSIEVGKYADLAVWDRNPYVVATQDLKDMQCEMTVFDGEIVFGQ